MASATGVPVAPVFFTMADVELVDLDVAPRLASWMASDHPDQMHLEEFLAHAVGVLAPRLSGLPDPVALRLDVALPVGAQLLEHHDLDNYGFPLAMRISRATGRTLASVRVTKSYGETSRVGVGPAIPAAGPSIVGSWTQVRTSASASTTAYKQQIHDQLAGTPTLTEGPVAVELSFTVGTRRSWPNVWKPTIDALGPLLGMTSPERSWHPRDGRIIDLHLHHHVDDSFGHDVAITVSAAHAG